MFKTLFSQSILKIFNYLFSLLIISYIANHLGLENLSIYFICIQFLLIISGICIYGFNITSQKYLPILKEEDYEVFKANSLLLTIIISIIVCLFLFFFLISLNLFNLLFSTKKNLFFLILAIPIYSLIIFSTEIIRSKNKIILSQFITLIIYPIFLIFFIYIFYVNFKKFDESYFFLIFFYSNTAVLFIILIFTRLSLFKFFYSINLRKLKNQFKVQFLFFINNYAVLISIYMYTFILNFYNLSYEISFFNISIMISSLIGLPLVFFINKYTRQFSINYDDKYKNIELFNNIKKISFYLGIILFFIIFITYFFLSDFLFSISFKDTYLLVFLTSAGFIINNYFGPNQIFLSIYNKQLIVFKILLVSIIFAFIIGCILIYYLKSLGACITFLFYQLILNILLNYNLKKIFS